MAVYKVKDPQGNIREIRGPDGASDEEIISQAQKLFSQPLKQVDVNGPTGPLSDSPLKNAAAGFGKAFVDTGRGVGQLLGMVSNEDIKESRRLDKPLMESGAGLAGNIAGNLAMIAPTAAIPGVNTVKGATALGSILGATAPAESTGERVLNTGVGGVLSGGAQGMANALTKGIGSKLNPEQVRLAQEAADQGITLTPAQKTGSKALRAFDAAFEGIPSTAGAQGAIQEKQLSEFTRAALRRAGSNAELATPDVLKSQKNAIGKTFEDIAGRNAINFTDDVVNDIAEAVNGAARRLVPDQAATVANTVDDIMAEVQAGTLQGNRYQAWRTELNRLARGNDSQAHYFGQLKKALDKGFSKSVSEADSAAWGDASQKYANIKTLIDAMGGPGVNPSSGYVQPAQLARALSNSVSREGKALGRGQLNDLSRIGSAFIADKMPNSGTAPRLLAQGILTGGSAGMLTGDPQTALEAGAAGLAAPALVRALMYSPAGQKALTEGLVSNPALINALKGAPQAAALPAMVNN